MSAGQISGGHLNLNSLSILGVPVVPGGGGGGTVQSVNIGSTSGSNLTVGSDTTVNPLLTFTAPGYKNGNSCDIPFNDGSNGFKVDDLAPLAYNPDDVNPDYGKQGILNATVFQPNTFGLIDLKTGQAGIYAYTGGYGTNNQVLASLGSTTGNPNGVVWDNLASAPLSRPPIGDLYPLVCWDASNNKLSLPWIGATSASYEQHYDLLNVGGGGISFYLNNSSSIRDNVDSIGTPGQVLTAGTGGQVIWGNPSAPGFTNPLSDYTPSGGSVNSDGTYSYTLISATQPLLTGLTTGSLITATLQSYDPTLLDGTTCRIVSCQPQLDSIVLTTAGKVQTDTSYIPCVVINKY